MRPRLLGRAFGRSVEQGAERGAGPGVERGAGTVLVAAVMVILALVGVVAVAASAFDAAQRDTAGAADLVALSAAAAYRFSGDACAAAATAAQANGVELTGCTMAGDSFDYAISVTVRRQIAAMPGWTIPVSATSVAGHLEPVG